MAEPLDAVSAALSTLTPPLAAAAAAVLDGVSAEPAAASVSSNKHTKALQLRKAFMTTTFAAALGRLEGIAQKTAAAVELSDFNSAVLMLLERRVTDLVSWWIAFEPNGCCVWGLQTFPPSSDLEGFCFPPQSLHSNDFSTCFLHTLIGLQQFRLPWTGCRWLFATSLCEQELRLHAYFAHNVHQIQAQPSWRVLQPADTRQTVKQTSKQSSSKSSRAKVHKCVVLSDQPLSGSNSTFHSCKRSQSSWLTKSTLAAACWLCHIDTEGVM